MIKNSKNIIRKLRRETATMYCCICTAFVCWVAFVHMALKDQWTLFITRARLLFFLFSIRFRNIYQLGIF